jgi:alpha-ketoglutarate-dependent taurine dioxygenase
MNPLNIESADAAVKAELFNGAIPLVIRPAAGDVSLVPWCAAHKEYIEASLDRCGAILFRGFGLATPQDFHAAARQLGGEPLDYSERSSPRSEVIQGVYTSTDYPARQSIFPHNETSYGTTFPLRLFFFCEIPPAKRGETPIADTRRVLARLSPATREKFRQKKWMLLRNLHGGNAPGYSWQDAFQLTDRSAVEEYCRKQDILFEWRPENALRVRHIHAAIETHPRTGEATWFNHAAFFHISTFERRVSDALLAVYGKENLPNNTYYGTGEELEPEVLDEIRAAYQAELVSFAWEKGDLLMIDNMLASHSRAPYEPPRKILVAMTMPYRRPKT